jgi:tetratricopeptide (TPR) repeat protein
MYLRFASISLLLSIFFFQSQGDLFRKHYEAANAAHRAGNYAAAEAEFKAILGEAYERLGKVYSAQGKYQASIEAFESANSTRPASADDCASHAG